VTISRTLFRNGTSEYAINGEACRLLDVQELLSDSGLGREMHVIVGQGQLDAVLRATPEDRRGFIEEAAGILKHRRRKERTLRKLDAMETNLTRLNDLAGEIRRQLKPLGRQAEVAKQAQGIAAEVRDAKARLLADDVARLRFELDELAKDEAERHSERIVLQEQLEQKQLRIARLEQEQQSDELDAARRVTISLESSQSRLRGLLSQTQQRLTFLATQAEAPEQAHRLTRGAVDEAVAEHRRLEELIPAAEVSWQEAGDLTRRAQQALDAIDEQIAEQSALVSKHDLELSKLRGQVQAAEQRQQAVAQELERRQFAVQQAEQRAEEAAQQLSQFEQGLDHADTPEAGLDDVYRAAQESQTAAEQARDECRDRLHQLEQERAGLDARISALARSLDQRDASGALLAESPAGVSGRVSDHVRVKSGYEAAIGAALGVFADALLADSSAAAGEVVIAARERDLGRLRAVIAHIEGAEPSESPRISGLTRAGDVLREAPTGVRGLLARSYLAETVEAAVAGAAVLRRDWPAETFTIVTTSGEVLTQHTLTGGSGLAPSRIELTAELEQSEQRREQLLGEVADCEAQLSELREAASRAKLDAERAFADLRTADARIAEVAEQRNRLAVRAEASAAELERARQALGEVSGGGTEAGAEVERAARAFAEAEARPRPMLDAGQRDTHFTELEAARAVEIERRLALETARERARAAFATHRMLAEQFAAEEQAAEEAARRAVMRARQVQQAERVAEVLPAILESCDRSLSEARVVQQTAEQARAKHSQELTLLRSEESELRSRLQSLTDRVHGAELKSYERKLQLSTLLERAGNELGLVEDVLIAEYGPEVLIPAPEQHAQTNDAETAETSEAAESNESSSREHAGDPVDEAPEVPAGVPFVRAEQERRLARAERQLTELGRINPLALEEFSALEQRHVFLVEQLRDLTRTRQDLLTIIGDLDEKMQGIFADAFADTQAAFAEVFPVLFPGGSGHIELSNPDDLLNTGIEMAVKPAGKKVERLSLLSGGERSLAAVAWLIAIFHARPSPFYIMDEVEAALDDANLGRLLQVFEGLREHSQLIVITHQKRTMEIADALYGVSMRQDGISAVVGQRIGREDD
ncbi:MAG: chromosome segregation protein SMC, partial [Microbacteriaceae bacterium]|nr:chromosome segregation protein SMC [Microbacteriaceae bacterium]